MQNMEFLTSVDDPITILHQSGISLEESLILFSSNEKNWGQKLKIVDKNE